MTAYRCWLCGGRHHSLDCPRLDDDERLEQSRGEVDRRALLALRRIHRQLQGREPR
jgi:hypothetical protein